MHKSLGILIAAVVAAGSLLVWVGSVSSTAGELQNKVTYIEKRQEEDRKNTREAISEVKEHTKVIDQNTQIILQKIIALEAIQRSERDRNGRR